ncbi:MAG: DUF748 domain-containing protein [Nitrospirales bacterium]|nr:DUF748 domain-containing protein [Nitrospirales bacterium]
MGIFRKRTLAIACSALVLFALIGFFLLPPVLKSILTGKLSAQLHRQVSIRAIAFNPFTLSFSIRGIVVRERTGEEIFFSCDEFFLNLQSLSLLKGGPIIREVRLVKPYVHISRSDDGTYNFSDLLSPGKEGARSPAQRPFRFSLNNISLLSGSIDFRDGPKKTTHTVRGLTVDIPFISNLPYYVERYVEPRLEAIVNGTAFSLKGKTKPFAGSHETTLTLKAGGISIPSYLAYSPVPLKFKVPSGLLDVNIGISFIQQKDKAPALSLHGELGGREFRITDLRGSSLLYVPLVSLGIGSSDLIAKKLHLSKVVVRSPEAILIREKTGKLNIRRILPEESTGERAAMARHSPPEETPFILDIDQVRLIRGKIALSDLSMDTPFKTTLEHIEVSLDHFSNNKEKTAALSASFQSDTKETAKLSGTFSVNPVVVQGNLEVMQVGLNKYAPYYRDRVSFDIVEGDAGLSTAFFAAKKGDDHDLRLSGLTATVRSLKVRKRGEQEYFLSIPSVSVRETGIDFGKRELIVGGCSSQKGRVAVKRLKDGVLNVQTLVPPSPQPTAASPEGTRREPARAWLYTIRDITVDGYTLDAEDLVPADPVTLSARQIRIRGKAISNRRGSRGRASISCRVGKKGSFSASGTVGMDPLSASLKLAAKGIDITPLQPYVAERANLYITEGNFSAGGRLSASYAEKEGVKVTYSGEAMVSNFASVDTINADDFLKWDTLHFDKMEVSYPFTSIKINETALSDFYSRIVINPDGTLNLQEVLRKEEVPQVAPVPEPAERRESGKPGTVSRKSVVFLNKVTLQGGALHFSDRYVKPGYAATMTEIGGRVSGLSSADDTFADVDLRGKLENYAPLQISGRINPLREDLFVDLKADFRDMDLSTVTPYSGRHLGYTIQKGKLAFSLQYLIVKKKLESRNNIFLDQLTFGERVESAEATKLPVKLAIALLKNRKGEISLDLPVTGQIDDPEFKIGRIILKMLTNLLVKAATSPFSLLGALFGGGEELSALEFDYGSAGIAEAGAKKLDILVKALSERPALNLEIGGYVDTEKDREGLRHYLFNKKLKAQKLKEMVRKGSAPLPVDDIAIEPTERPLYLKRAYREEKFPKPRNFIGMVKDLPIPEMEKLMLAHIEIKDEDLRQLAAERALRVKDYLLKSEKIEQKRIFLITPRSLQPENKETMKDSRVDFTLK